MKTFKVFDKIIECLQLYFLTENIFFDVDSSKDKLIC